MNLAIYSLHSKEQILAPRSPVLSKYAENMQNHDPALALPLSTGVARVPIVARVGRTEYQNCPGPDAGWSGTVAKPWLHRARINQFILCN